MRAGEDTRPYADAGTVLFSSQGPVRDRPAGAHCAPLRRIQNGFVFLVGAGPRPARQDSHRERWLVKARCRN